MIEIRSSDRKAAFAVIANAYPADSTYVPPMWSDFDRMLDPARNPLMTQGHGRFELFTALRDGRPLGASSRRSMTPPTPGTARGVRSSAISTAPMIPRSLRLCFVRRRIGRASAAWPSSWGTSISPRCSRPVS